MQRKQEQILPQEPIKPNKPADAQHELLFNFYTELFKTEQDFCHSMSVFANELKRLRDTGFELEELKGKQNIKSVPIKISDEDHFLLSKLIENAEELAKSPLIEPNVASMINSKDFLPAFKQSMDHFSADDQFKNDFKSYITKMSDYVVQYEYISKTLSQISEKYLNNKYKNVDQEGNIHIKNKTKFLSAELIKPVQRGPRYLMLLNDMDKQLNAIGGDLQNSEQTKLNKVQENISEQLKALNERKRASEALLDTSMPTYVAQKGMLHDFAALIDKRYAEKNRPVTLPPSEKQLALFSLKQRFDHLNRFENIVVSKEGLKNQLKSINPNEMGYLVLGHHEKLLHKAFAKLDQLNIDKVKNKEKIAKQEEVISSLVKLIVLDHKKNYVVRAQQIAKETKAEIQLLLKEGILVKSDFGREQKKRMNKIKKDYSEQAQGIKKEMDLEEAKLKKNEFIKQTSQEINSEKKLPAPNYIASLPPSEPPPPLPSRNPIFSPPPSEPPPPLPEGLKKTEQKNIEQHRSSPPQRSLPKIPSYPRDSASHLSTTATLMGSMNVNVNGKQQVKEQEKRAEKMQNTKMEPLAFTANKMQQKVEPQTKEVPIQVKEVKSTPFTFRPTPFKKS